MKRTMRAAAWLFPKRWRKRYGDEFEALIEDSRADWRSLMDVFLEAIKMQFTHWGFTRIMMGAAVAGAVITAGVSFSLPDQWESSAVIKITPGQIPEDMLGQRAIDQMRYDRIDSTAQAIESRRVLTTVINNFGLYPRERSREPMEDVIKEMKAHIVIVPIGGDDVNGAFHAIPPFAVKFAYEDQRKAQQVVEDLATRFIDENRREASREPAFLRGAGERLEILDPPSFPQHKLGPNRLALTAVGSLAGLTGGLLLAIAVRARRKSHEICPTCGRPLAEPDTGLKHA